MRRFLVAVTLLLVCTSALLAFDVEATIKKVDPDKGVLVFTAGQQERTLKVPPSVKILDAAGKEISDGLKARELKEGASVTLTIERDGDRPVLKVIRLSKRSVAVPAWNWIALYAVS